MNNNMDDMNQIDVQVNRIYSKLRSFQVDNAEVWMAFSEYAHRECEKIVDSRFNVNNKLSTILDVVAGVVLCGGFGIVATAMMMI